MTENKYKYLVTIDRLFTIDCNSLDSIYDIIKSSIFKEITITKIEL